MRQILPLLLAVTACVDTVTEQLDGQLVQVEVVTSSDSCAPARVSGDGGVQFLATRADGSLVLTVAQSVQYGPQRDGGALDSTRLLHLPALDDNVQLGAESGCGLFGSLRASTDGGVLLEQRFPGMAECPSGPLWLPATACTATRVLTLRPLGACRLECIRLSTSSEVSCEC